MMTSPQLGYLTNVCDFISTPVISMTTKLGRMANQHALILSHFTDMMASPRSGHMTNVYGFISAPIRPITTKVGRMVDEHELIYLAGTMCN